MNDTTFDATLTARELVRGFEKMAPGRYVVTRYGKPWRVIVVEEVGAGSGTAAGPAPVDCVAVQPAPVLVGRVVPEVVTAPAVVLDVAPVTREDLAERSRAKIAALMARGRGDVAGPEPASEPAALAMTRREWRKLGPDARSRWVRANTPALDSDEAVAEWLEGLPA